MSNSVTTQAAEKVRRILSSLGIRHTVGTSRDDRGGSVVIVDVPELIFEFCNTIDPLAEVASANQMSCNTCPTGGGQLGSPN